MTNSDPTGMSTGLGDLLGIVGAVIGGALGGLVSLAGAAINAVGSLGNGGGTAPTGSNGTTYKPLNGWTPGATWNLITQSWDTPFNRPSQSMEEWFASMPEWGIVDDPKAANQWESSRGLFFGWLWGGGYPLSDHQDFRGGDAFTAILANDDTLAKWRATLMGQARDKGMKAPYAKEAAEFAYRDRGPEPGRPWYKFNSLRGFGHDMLGVLTNGGLGTENSADAFLGSYSATGRVKSVNRRENTVTLKFTATNISDWRSATHAIPRSWNPTFADTFGAAVTQDFSWEEKWPVNESVNYSEWLE